MAKIKKSRSGGAVVYPATIYQAVKDPNSGQRLDEKLAELDEATELVVSVEDEGDVNDPEADIVNEALRKTPQTLTKAEQAQARTNIGAASLEENAAFKEELTESNEAFKTETNTKLLELSESVQEQIDKQDENISGNFAKLIPTGMDVSCLTSLTKGNKSLIPIDMTLYPDGVAKNIICISDNKAVSITPDGRLKVVGTGTSIVHVVPTLNTSLAKTLEIKVTDPSVRLVSSSSIRLISSGSFRFN